MISQAQLPEHFWAAAALAWRQSCCKTTEIGKGSLPGSPQSRASSLGFDRCKVRPKVTQHRLEIPCFQISEPNVVS